MLTTAIPEVIWSVCPCFVIHPGPVGDRGPSSLDWAIMGGAERWGVTVLQANAEMDAGDIWASAAALALTGLPHSRCRLRHAVNAFDCDQFTVDHVNHSVRPTRRRWYSPRWNASGGYGSAASAATAAPCFASRPDRLSSAAPRLLPQATTRSSMVAEQLCHRHLMAHRSRPSGSHPVPMRCQRRLHLGLLEQLRRCVTLHRLESPQVGERNDRCRFPAQVDHLIRTWVAVWLRRHSRYATGLL
jgi:hypothetical protein